MLFAVFTSQSWAVPQSHVHFRAFSGTLSCKAPQSERSLEKGNQRPVAITGLVAVPEHGWTPAEEAAAVTAPRRNRHP